MRFQENFDSGITNANWLSTNYTITSTAGLTHKDLAGNGSTFSANMSNSAYTNVFGVGDRWFYTAVYSTSSNQELSIVNTQKLSVEAMAIGWNSFTGVINIRRGGLVGTILASSAGVAAGGMWHYFWCDMIVQNAGGSVYVYMDGNQTPVVSATGDTTAATTDGFDQFAFTGGALRYFDDMVTFTNTEKVALAGITFPELFSNNIVPTSDVTNTFSSGGFASVDETTWSTGDYAESLTAGQELICGVTGLAFTPTNVCGVVLQGYVARDGVINQFGGILQSGGVTITVKQSCNLATNGALPAYTAAGAGPGKTLTGNAVGVLTVDGVAVVLNNRVLVKEGTAIDNGIYKCTIEGTAGVAFVLTRATDFDEIGPGAEVDTGDVTYILTGTANALKTYRLTTADPITVDTTALTFAEMAAVLQSKTGAGAASYVPAQWFFPLDPNGDIQWTYVAAQAAKPGIQTQTAI